MPVIEVRPGVKLYYMIKDHGYKTPCWVAMGPLHHGYGIIINPIRRKAPIKAHRAIYELYKDKIPEGLQIDHLCCVKACVNPEHLEPVTNAENQRSYHAKESADPTSSNYRRSARRTIRLLIRSQGLRNQ